MQLLCLGDVALADQPWECAIWAVPGYLTPSADKQVMFNWEFPIGETPNNQPRVSGKRYVAYPDSVSIIKNWTPGIATMATNHILDAREEGLAETINSLQHVGFKTVGAGTTVEEIARPLLWETGEGRLAIINWVFAETHPDWNTVPGPNCWPGLKQAKRTIQMLKQDFDWVLVVVHWSDELFPFPLPKDREIAHELASMGADGVVGHHPHVVRGMEVIGTCPVFYSLGNFYFAERQDNAGNWLSRQAPRNREGLGVKFTFQHNRKPEYELLSFWNNGQEAVLDKICRAMRRMRSTSIPLQIYQGTAYRNWYKIQRARFDKWDSRWHFGVMKRGVVDTLYRLIVRFYKTSYMSK